MTTYPSNEYFSESHPTGWPSLRNSNFTTESRGMLQNERWKK